MDLTRHLAETQHFFTRAQALDRGWLDKHLTAGVRDGSLVRFRHGYYTYADLWNTLDEVGRHLVRCHAVVHSMGEGVALSHISAAVAHGMATWGLDLSRVHVTRLDKGAGRIEGDVVHHEGIALADDVVTVDGQRLVVVDRAAIETATMGTPEQSLVVLDSFLHQGHGSHTELFARFEKMERWPRTQHLHLPLRMADGDADGPGESRGRWFFWTHGIPAPRLQFHVVDAQGEVRGTTDWAWPDEGLLGEFDGRVKYGRLVREGQVPGDVVFAEKEREDLLRSLTDWKLVRIIWDDFQRPRVLASRVLGKMRAAG